MAILKVAKLGSPILRKRASEIEAQDLRKGRFRTFFEDMMETMAEYHGTGLAAPQVSHGLRVGDRGDPFRCLGRRGRRNGQVADPVHPLQKDRKSVV